VSGNWRTGIELEVICDFNALLLWAKNFAHSLRSGLAFVLFTGKIVSAIRTAKGFLLSPLAGGSAFRVLIDDPRPVSSFLKVGQPNMPPVSKSLGQGTQSVLLTVEILEQLASSEGPVGISDLARQIGTSKSRIFRHLQTLVECGFISRNADGEYEAGSRLLTFCRAINERYDPVSIAEPILYGLKAKLGHTVIISRIVSTGIYVIKSISGDSSIVLAMRPGSVLPFDRSAQGLVALAFMPVSARKDDTEFARAYERFAQTSPEQLEVIRKQGWAAAQMREGLVGVAAPVFGRSGRLIATLGMLDTAAAMKPESVQAKGEALVEAAEAVSQGLTAAGVTSI